MLSTYEHNIINWVISSIDNRQWITYWSAAVWRRRSPGCELNAADRSTPK
jgi:hypothetical protein